MLSDNTLRQNPIEFVGCCLQSDAWLLALRFRVPRVVRQALIRRASEPLWSMVGFPAGPEPLREQLSGG